MGQTQPQAVRSFSYTAIKLLKIAVIKVLCFVGSLLADLLHIFTGLKIGQSVLWLNEEKQTSDTIYKLFDGNNFDVIQLKRFRSKRPNRKP